MKLAMAQMSMTSDMNQNFEKTLRFVREAKGSDLLFFPEVQLTPFFAQYPLEVLEAEKNLNRDDLSISLQDERIGRLTQECREQRMYVSPNFYVKKGEKYYDMSLMLNREGQYDGIAKMVHVVSAPFFYEADYYTPSEEGFQVFHTDFGKVGIVICFDRHLPESIRTCVAMGAELIIIPTANTAAEPMEMFEQEIRVQAYQNNVFIAMCNRVGQEDAMCFAGESLVVDCNGNTLLKADDRERLLTIGLDLSACRESREKRPYFNLRRPEMYH